MVPNKLTFEFTKREVNLGGADLTEPLDGL